jgi:DNA-binding transcriptional LysR family regulator
MIGQVFFYTRTLFERTSRAHLREGAYFGGMLVAKPLPFEVPSLELYVMWHPREAANPFHRWLRESLLAHAKIREQNRHSAGD